MPAPIDFYFDFSSPYGYLASRRIDALASAHGRKVAWRPILLGVAFKATGGAPLPSIPIKGAYAMRDFLRSARFHGIPYHQPTTFPVSTISAVRAFYWLQDRDPAKAVELAKALYNAYFTEDVDISKPDNVAKIAGKLGVKAEELLVSQPDNGEQALEIADTLVRSGAIDVLVIDSVAALVPRAEIEGDMGDPQMGLQARLMSQALRKLTATIAKSRTIVVFINQIRMKIGVMFGNPETTTGGNALKFYASVRLDIRRLGAIKHGDEVIGSRTRVKVVKNKVAPPFREAEFDILYGTGISKEGELIDLASEHGIVEKSGAWYAFNGDRIGQGRENARDFLREHEDIAITIEQKVREKFGVRDASPAGAGDSNGTSAEGARTVEAVRKVRGGKE